MSKKPEMIAHKLAFGARFFQFQNPRNYLLLGSFLLANGIMHGSLAIWYLSDPEGSKRVLAQLPLYFEHMALGTSKTAMKQVDVDMDTRAISNDSSSNSSNTGNGERTLIQEQQ